MQFFFNTFPGLFNFSVHVRARVCVYMCRYCYVMLTAWHRISHVNLVSINKTLKFLGRVSPGKSLFILATRSDWTNNHSVIVVTSECLTQLKPPLVYQVDEWKLNNLRYVLWEIKSWLFTCEKFLSKTGYIFNLLLLLLFYFILPLSTKPEAWK